MNERQNISIKIDNNLAVYGVLLKRIDHIGQLMQSAVFGFFFSAVISIINLWFNYSPIIYTSWTITTVLIIGFSYLMFKSKQTFKKMDKINESIALLMTDYIKQITEIIQDKTERNINESSKHY